MSINKQELVARYAEKADITKKEAEKRITDLFDLVEDIIAKGEKLQLVGHGTYEKKVIKGKEGKIKVDGVEKAWKTEDSFGVKFKAGKKFVDKLNVIFEE